METATILSHVDHTLLKPEATWDQIKTLCDEAMEFGCATVCIPPSYVKRAAEYVQGNLKICTVIGFPNGYNTMAAKIFETKDSVENGSTREDVALLRENLPKQVKLKASGGIRTLADGEAYLALGADRLGASALVGEARKQG